MIIGVAKDTVAGGENAIGDKQQYLGTEYYGVLSAPHDPPRRSVPSRRVHLENSADPALNKLSLAKTPMMFY